MNINIIFRNERFVEAGIRIGYTTGRDIAQHTEAACLHVKDSVFNLHNTKYTKKYKITTRIERWQQEYKGYMIS